jgi:hypothetical protein
VVKIQVAVFWVVMSCSAVVGIPMFRKSMLLHLQGEVEL